MQITVVIPCYNEAPRLPRTFQEITSFIKDQLGKQCVITEIIVVDDGSSDETIAISTEWLKALPITIAKHEKNLGKGAALRTGVTKATGDYILLFDADSATPISELPKLCDVMRNNSADIVIGCRNSHQSAGVTVKMSLHRKFIGRVYHALTTPLIPNIKDAACGFKLFRAGKAKKLFAFQQINRFAYDIEILSLALHLKWKIVEVPVNWNAIPISKVRIFRDGIEMLFKVIKLYTLKISKRGIFKNLETR